MPKRMPRRRGCSRDKSEHQTHAPHDDRGLSGHPAWKNSVELRGFEPLALRCERDPSRRPMWLGVARFPVKGRNRTVQQVPRGPMSAADGSPPGSHHGHVDVRLARSRMHQERPILLAETSAPGKGPRSRPGFYQVSAHGLVIDACEGGAQVGGGGSWVVRMCRSPRVGMVRHRRAVQVKRLMRLPVRARSNLVTASAANAMVRRAPADSRWWWYSDWADPGR